MAVHEDRVRAQLGGGAQRHGGMHAKLARLVRRGRDHAALVALAAHHHRLSLQRRIGQLFHRHEERIHVDVEDGLGELRHRREGERAKKILPVFSSRVGVPVVSSHCSACVKVFSLHHQFRGRLKGLTAFTKCGRVWLASGRRRARLSHAQRTQTGRSSRQVRFLITASTTKRRRMRRLFPARRSIYFVSAIGLAPNSRRPFTVFAARAAAGWAVVAAP